MTLAIHWRLDPAADRQRSEPSLQSPLPDFIRDRRAANQNRFDYYLQVAEAAAQTAFDGLYIRHRIQSDESRIIAAVVARAVPRLQIIPEFPASVGSAVYAAKQAATFQRGTQGRLGWAIAPDADHLGRERESDPLGDEELNERLDEFLTVARGVHDQRPFSFKGQYYEVQNGGFEPPLTRFAFPRVYLQGEDDDALALSARHADVHIFRAATAAELADSVARLDELAAGEGRRVAAGLIQPLLARSDAAQAAEDASGRTLSPGALVGSYDQVAEQLAHFADAGITELVLSAAPDLEEAYRTGQEVLPRLRALTARGRKAA